MKPLITLFLAAFLHAPLFSAQPNIVLILVDDQGLYALSTPADPGDPRSGSSYFQTPR
jgi:hypothetical protein